jgi:hypothetical protein
MFAHESDKNRKPLFKTGKTGPSGLVNWHSMRELLLWLSDVWIDDWKEPQKPWRLRRLILDLIDEKKEN